MLSSAVDRICSSSVWEETSFCWNKKGKWNDYHSFKDKHIFLLDENVSLVRELNNTLTMWSSEDDGICSSSVWGETSFCWKKKPVNESIIYSFKEKYIFLLEESVSRVTHVNKYLDDVVVIGRQNLFLFRLGIDFFLLEQKDRKWNDYHSFKHKHIFLLDENASRVTELKNTLTMLSSEVDRICSSSVWEETSFCWNKKTGNEMIIILLNTRTFCYWTRTCVRFHRA